MKKSFILHLDSLSILDEMTFEQKGILFDAIYKYQQGEEINLDFAMKMAFAPFKNQFIRDNEKYNEFKERQTENGKKGGRPPKDKPNLETQDNPKNPSLLSETQKSLNDSVKDSDSDSESKNDNESNKDLEKEISKEILERDLENEKLRLEIERLNQALEEKNKKVSTKGGAAKAKKVSWLDLKEMELPEIYNEEEFRETWQSWCDFKQSRKENVLTDKGFDFWFKNLETLSSRDLSISIQIVNQSIANNWQGIFELKNQKSYAASKPNSQKSTTPYGAVGGVNSQGRGMFLIPLDDSTESSQGNDCIEVEGFYQSEL